MLRLLENQHHQFPDSPPNIGGDLIGLAIFYVEVTEFRQPIIDWSEHVSHFEQGRYNVENAHQMIAKAGGHQIPDNAA